MTSPSHGGDPEFESPRAHQKTCRVAGEWGLVTVVGPLFFGFRVLDLVLVESFSTPRVDSRVEPKDYNRSCVIIHYI